MKLSKGLIKLFKGYFFRNVIFGMIAILILVSCGKHEQLEPKETILVKIGDKSISVSEFIRRAGST